LYNRFRAWHEEPGCYSFRSDTDQRVNILEAWPDYERAGLQPGQIFLADEGVAVGTGTTPLMLGRVQPAGKGAMSATDWLRGLPSGVGFRV
ncbi:MAG: methionyl-tRNA formyltransferase, partial [Pontimonas sp.]